MTLSVTCPNCGTAFEHEPKPHRDLPPTRRQWQVLEFLRDFIVRNGYPPSLPEIAKAFGHTSKGCVRGLVNGLKERGLIDFEPHRARTITICKRAFEKGYLR